VTMGANPTHRALPTPATARARLCRLNDGLVSLAKSSQLSALLTETARLAKEFRIKAAAADASDTDTDFL